MPSLDRRHNLQRGHAAKLIFDIETETEEGRILIHGERMWAIVAEKIGDVYVGILDNQPSCFEPNPDVYLCFGAEIPFKAEHVIKIETPPPEYVDWQLSQEPERLWSRD